MNTSHHEDTKDTKNTKLSLDVATETLGAQVVDAMFKVFRVLGPGLLESAYEACLAHELSHRGLKVQTQVLLPLVFEDLYIEGAYRVDLLIEDTIIVELKCAEHLLPIHEAQLLTYLRLGKKRLGYLVNFHAHHFKYALKRFIN